MTRDENDNDKPADDGAPEGSGNEAEPGSETGGQGNFDSKMSTAESQAAIDKAKDPNDPDFDPTEGMNR